MARLTNKTAVITGGTTGIGFETAKLFIAEDAQVIITGRSQTRLDEAVAALGPNATGIKADVQSLDELDRLAIQVKNTVGQFDILFANAGIAKRANFRDVTEADFDQEVAINFKGAFFTVQKLEPLMNNGGSIILTTTVLDQTALPGEGIYGASKAAVRSLARSLSRELLDRQIRVNAVAPGPIETPIWSKMDLPEDVPAQVLRRTPIGRFGQPEEIAKAVLFLASDDSSYMLGEEILVDGGWATL
ncbi:SDR family oxidoreductase [Leptothoe spongobia]|uniref:SDR family oxidoreductase n=1 Tax=Leptothoe spongobia TAU-MAC 1115 TaxID=1967444 RepID=A0A947GJA5_9CYAN|nr:SDR family oxidoreductase [Leptothoe spongobia]MBT9315537.1 SDR family oxidoreductase [Leptothoe spongobia TAU-MAC 1115]